MNASTSDSRAGRPRLHDRFSQDLPVDAEVRNHPRQVHGAVLSRVGPRPAPDPRLLVVSPEVVALLGLDPAWVDSPDFAEVMAGSRELEGAAPYAQCYGGHQFGQWAGQLGDGRAINLGEVKAPDGAHWVLQLKGAGPTPYSRTADGFAVLRSSVREFLCSEAMHHLGVPTTRALSLVTTGRSVVRDMFYDGHPQQEAGAVVCRVARSFLRFGSYELPTSRGDEELLRRLVDHTLRRHFPDLAPAPGEAPGRDAVMAWFREVCRTTMHTVGHWMRVGFVHGVLNTDNMSILGETIDYGPYGWLEDYDEQWTPNTTDASGRRYRYGAQPAVAHWNLLQLARALLPLLGEAEPLQEILDAIPGEFAVAQREMFAAKLGWKGWSGEEDDAQIGELLELLSAAETDFTVFFRRLATVSSAPASMDDPEGASPIADAWYVPAEVDRELRLRWARWLESYRGRCRQDGLEDRERRRGMDRVNPHYVPRNYLAQLAIDDAEKGDPTFLLDLLETLRRPYEEQPGREHHAAKRPDWARHRAGCSMLSCSS